MDDGSLTQRELQAELDTLRSLRRRSVSQPSDGIDPDLPPSPTSFSINAPGSPTFNQRSPTLGSSSPPYAGSPRTPTFGTPSIRSDASTSRSASLNDASISTSPMEASMDDDVALGADYSDLFWLPARLHPEIAPQEFRNFLKDQTTPENLLRRSGSTLGRKKSMLSKQVHLSDMGSDSDESNRSKGKGPAGMARTPSRSSSFRRSTGLERLTLNDLQRLEQLARQAAEEGQAGAEGEAKLKHMVRRSMSLNPASLLENADELASLTQDHDKPFEHEADAPLIVPPPGSILRRSARTKIRKPSLLGDGGGHRFGPSRRTHRSISPMLEDDESPDEQPLTNEDRKGSISSQISLETLESASTDETATESPIGVASIVSQPIPVQYVRPSGSPYDSVIAPSSHTDRQPNLDKRRTPSRAASVSQAQQQTSPTRVKGHPQAGDLSVVGRMYNTADEQLEASRQLAEPAGSIKIAKTGSQPLSTPLANIRPRTVSAPTRPDRTTSKDELPPKAVALPPGAAPAAASITAVAPHLQTKVVPQQSHTAPRPQNLQLPLPSTAKPAAAKPKEKKSGWAKLGLSSRSGKAEPDADDTASVHSTASSHSTFSLKSDKSGKKGKKEQEKEHLQERKKPLVTSPERPTAEPQKEKSEGSGGFFGGIFGSRRKSEQAEEVRKDAGPVRAAVPAPAPTASGMLTAEGRYVTFYRLPIHIERAVYRLSHIKLANPRRPLYEQVLISNLMFWYLGVINKATAPPVSQPPPHQKILQPSMQSSRSPESTHQHHQQGHHASPQGHANYGSGHQTDHNHQPADTPHQAMQSARPLPHGTAPAGAEYAAIPPHRGHSAESPYSGYDGPADNWLNGAAVPPSDSQHGQGSLHGIHDAATTRPARMHQQSHGSIEHARPTSLPNGIEEKVAVSPRPLSDSSQPESDSAPISLQSRVPPPVPPARNAVVLGSDKSKVLPRPARSASMSQNTAAVPVVADDGGSNSLIEEQRRLSAVTDIISSYIDDEDYQRAHASSASVGGKSNAGHPFSAMHVSTDVPPGHRSHRSPVSPPPRALSPNAIQQHS